MSEFDDILIQLDKERFRRTTDRWTTAQGLRLENEFPDANAVPYGKQVDPDTNKPSVSTITTQLRKKRVSKKSLKDRIADKSVLLADRLKSHSYK
jgi:hypothetical protein